MLESERGAALVVVLGLMILLSVMVVALMTASSIAARTSVNVWNQQEAKLAAEAGVQRMIFEAERVMTDNDSNNPVVYPDPSMPSKPKYWSDLTSALTTPLDAIPGENDGNLGPPSQGVSLGDGQTYSVPLSTQPGGVNVTVQQDQNDGNLVDVTIEFSSTGAYQRSSVTLNATVALQANVWLLYNGGQTPQGQDTVMLTNLSYQ